MRTLLFRFILLFALSATAHAQFVGPPGIIFGTSQSSGSGGSVTSVTGGVFNGVTITFQNTTTTPSISAISLGAITPTSVTDAGLTSGRVVFSTTAGLLTDASTLTFNSGTGALTATTFVGALSGNATTSTTAGNVSGIVLGANGGTGVANTGSTITLGGNLITSGAFATTLISTGTTSITLPTGGTLALAGANSDITSMSGLTGSLVSTSVASPATMTISAQNSRGGTDNNVAGASMTIASGKGTGSAAASSISFQTPTVGSSGTTQETLGTTFQITTTAVIANAPSTGTVAMIQILGGATNQLEFYIRNGDGAEFIAGLNTSDQVFLSSNSNRSILIQPGGSTTHTFTSTGTETQVYSGAGGGLNLKNSDNTTGTDFLSFQRGDGTEVGSVTRVTTTSAVTFNTTSDARLKTNIRDFKDSGRLIDSLTPRMFDWKTGEKDFIGFVAQEENAADPTFARIGAVTVGDSSPDRIHQQWQRSDQVLVPIIVAEEKSLRLRVANLEHRSNSDWVARLLGTIAIILGLIANWRRNKDA